MPRRYPTRVDLNLLLGCAVTLGAAWLQGRERQTPPVLVIDAWMVCVGGRFWSSFLAVAGPKLRQQDIGWALISSTGVASLGGLTGGPAVASAFFAIHPASRGRVLAMLDIMVPAVLAYLIFARLGCFAAGCFDRASAACIYQGIPVHSTQLHLAAGNLAILVALLVLRNRPILRGPCYGSTSWPMGRCASSVELYRGDVGPVVGALSLSQVLCLAASVIGIGLLSRRLARGNPVPP